MNIPIDQISWPSRSVRSQLAPATEVLAMARHIADELADVTLQPQTYLASEIHNGNEPA